MPHCNDRAVARACKRLLDMVLAGTLFLLMLPVMLCVAIFIRMTMGSPILFRQVRPGFGGKPITVYKFRTMTDARDARGNLLSDAERLKSGGRILRRFSLDELPQLYNVVVGDLSLVGPRPLLMEYLSCYSARHMRRHEVRPGITGWAQINGRNALEWKTRLDLDVWYVDHWSLWLDLTIIVRTISKVFTCEGISAREHVTMPKLNDALERRKYGCQE